MAEFNITIAGPAGSGIAKAALVLSKALTRKGYYVFNYRDYGSLIRGGHNFNTVCISDSPVFSHSDSRDFLIAMDKRSLESHKAKNTLSFDNLPVSEIVKQLEAPAMVANSVFLGALFSALKLPLDWLNDSMNTEFGKHAEINKRAAARGYEAYSANKIEFFQPKSKAKHLFISGSEAFGLGAIAAGIDLYIAYPMTPATPVLHFLAARQKEHDFAAIQLENEIAVANAALGASYAGANTMIGTSGGGLALMSEALSLQGISEVPLVVYMAQRTGPATGVPTYTAQSDMKFVVNAGHGEFPRAVIAPGDPAEAFQRTAEAFYLSHKYGLLSILLSDKHLSESNFSFDKLPELRVKPERFIAKPSDSYKSYEITDNGISPRAVPGQAIVRATSYEHDELGHTIEDGPSAIKMIDKRKRKLETLKQEIAKLNPIELHGSGENTLVSWGSTKGAVIDALPKMKDWQFLQISYLSPFPAEQVERILNNSSETIIVENSSTGQIADLVAEQTGVRITDKLLKYDARPFTPQDIIKGIERVIS